MTQNDHHQLAELILLPEEDLQRQIAMLQDLLDLRRRHCRPPGAISGPRPQKSRPPVLDNQSPALVQRRPMRPPSPGSLRAMVHEVLASRKEPMQRAEVISEVARLRGVQVDQLLKAKVSDALSNKHDPAIQKVAPGLYAATPPQITCL